MLNVLDRERSAVRAGERDAAARHVRQPRGDRAVGRAREPAREGGARGGRGTADRRADRRGAGHARRPAPRCGGCACSRRSTSCCGENRPIDTADPSCGRFRAVHLADYLAIRAVPAAGVSLALTRRCPLNCAHCATNSTVDERGGARPSCSSASSTASPPRTIRRCSRSPAARRSCGPRSCGTSPSARRSSAAGRRRCRACSGRRRAASRRRSSARSTCSTTSRVSLDVFHEREVRR